MSCAGQGEVDNGGRENSPEPTVSEIEFSGIVSLQEKGPTLDIRDPAAPCGDPQAEISVEGAVPDDPHRGLFSADWSYMAIPVDDAIHVLELDHEAKAYKEAFTLSSEDGGYSEVSGKYHNPKFSPDGEKLWFEKVVEDEVTLVSVEYADHEDGDKVDESGPTFERYANAAQDETRWTFSSDGAPEVAELVRLEGESEEIFDAEAWVTESGQVAYVSTFVENPDASVSGDLAKYVPVEGIPAPQDDVLVHGFSSLSTTDSATPYGVIARAAIDPGNGTVSLSEVVPLGGDKELADVVLVREDGEQALFQLPEASVVYTTSIGDGDEPERLAENACLDTAFAWA